MKLIFKQSQASKGMLSKSIEFSLNARVELTEAEKSNIEKYAGHLRCPVIDAEMIGRFIKFGEQNRWGKKRLASPKASVWFGQQLERLSTITTKIFANLPNVDLGGGKDQIEVGLNVLGQGGGQWTLTQNDDGQFSCRVGLPAVGQPTLQIESSRLESLVMEIEQLGQATTGQPWDLLTEKIEAAITLSRA